VSNERGGAQEEGEAEEEGGVQEEETPGVVEPETKPPEVVPPEVVPPTVIPPEIRQPEKKEHEKRTAVKKTHKKKTHEAKPSQEDETEEVPPEDGTPEIETPEEVETPEDVDTPTEGGDGETETPVDEAEETETPAVETGRGLLEINELQTELTTVGKHAEFIELKVAQSGNLDGVCLYIMYEADSPFVYNFPDITVAEGDIITLHLQKLETVCIDELGENLSASGGNESCPTARDLWVSGTAELLHKTDIVYLQDANGRFMDAVVLNEKPGASWNNKQAHFAEITKKLFTAGMWMSADGSPPAPLDAVNTSSIGTSIHKSVSRYKDRENFHTATDWYIAEAGYSTPGMANSK
jgi:hypothetical protein